MDSLALARSHALNNIPRPKHLTKIQAILEACVECAPKAIKPGKSLEGGLCDKCRITVTAYNRYYETNIPIEYWDLKMDKDFHGYQGLLNKYNDYAGDLRLAYTAGASVCFAGSHGLGKQLSLDTELPTPNGFIKLSSLKEGDELFDENGNICKVIELHPINISPESYEIEFDDGTTVKACADHQWLTWTRNDRVNNTIPKVKSTKEILQTLKFKNGIREAANHSIPCTKPVQYLHKELLIAPYVLGIWLGDGLTLGGNIETSDIEVLDKIKKEGYSINAIESTISNTSKSSAYRIGDLTKINNHWIGKLKSQLQKLNLLDNKHIPNIYLHSSYEQRLELLKGLLDSDGTCNDGGTIEYCSTIKNLAEGFHQLVLSLGIKASINKNKSFLYGVRIKDRYRITFTTKLPVFNLTKKLSNIRLEKSQINRSTHRYIVNIKKISPIPMRCITVNSLSHLFLITRAFIPTHNTMTTTCILKKACQKGYNCLYTTLSDIVNVLTAADSQEKFLARKELIMVDFLVIDEFDSRFIATDNAADLYARTLEGIFRTRSQNRLPTLMCTNSPNIVETFSGPLKQSIDSLMKGYLKIFPVLGEDFRKKDK